MALNRTLKLFLSLASAICLLDHSFTSAALLGDLAEGPSKSARCVFGTGRDEEFMKGHLANSAESYGKVMEKIGSSIDKGNVVYVEDGEADDIWHNLLGVMRGKAPKEVYMQGGYHKLRKTCADEIWKYLHGRFDFDMPEIYTIYGRAEDFSPIQEAEGTGLLSPEEIEQLKLDSKNPFENKYYKQQVERAQKGLRQTLENNDFTTIVLKTAPGGLTEVLKKYREKVAIIWTGPIKHRPSTGTYEKRYNYHQAMDESNELLELKIPTIIVSPWLENTRMTSIVDSIFMEEYSKHTEVVDGFPGFKNLARVHQDENAKFSHYINVLADKFKANLIARTPELKIELEQQLKDLMEKNPGLTDEHPDLKNFKNEQSYKLELGERWTTLDNFAKQGLPFREFCPVDQSAEIVTNPLLRPSVTEVVEVSMKPSANRGEVILEPMIGGKTWVITKFDSKLLEEALQRSIDWMVQGEPDKRGKSSSHH